MNAMLDDEEIKEHVKDRRTWMRFVVLLILGFAFFLSGLLSYASSLLQFLSKLFSGTIFNDLACFGRALAAYQAQITRYMTFASDEKPFPFAPFPSGEPLPLAMPDKSFTPPEDKD